MLEKELGGRQHFTAQPFKQKARADLARAFLGPIRMTQSPRENAGQTDGNVAQTIGALCRRLPTSINLPGSDLSGAARVPARQYH
jgi:hypothetical protein